MTICLLKEEWQKVRREQFPPCNFTFSGVAGDPSVWFGVIEKKPTVLWTEFITGGSKRQELEAWCRGQCCFLRGPQLRSTKAITHLSQHPAATSSLCGSSAPKDTPDRGPSTIQLLLVAYACLYSP